MNAHQIELSIHIWSDSPYIKLYCIKKLVQIKKGFPDEMGVRIKVQVKQ